MHLENLPFNYEEAVAVLLFVIGVGVVDARRLKKVVDTDKDDEEETSAEIETETKEEK